VISMSVRFGHAGTRCSGGGPPLTCHVIFCFVFWPIGFRPIVSAIWIPTADGYSMVRDHPKMVSGLLLPHSTAEADRRMSAR
jgi:hypothetical protein